ncbi:MAG: ATP-binding protein [Candidatus Omnitrophota bacterium]
MIKCLTIGKKITIGFLLIGVLMGTIGCIMLMKSQKALEQCIGENAVTLAVEMLNEIDRNMYVKSNEIRICVKDFMLKQALKKSNEKFDKMNDVMEFIKEKNKEWIAGEEDISYLIDSDLSRDLKDKIDISADKYNYPVFAEEFITNKYGVNVAQSGKTTDYYQADEEWWQVAKEDGLYMGDVEYDRSAKVWSNIIAMRIEDEKQNFLGVFKATLNIQETIDMLTEAQAEIFCEKQVKPAFVLTNKEGRIICCTAKKKGCEILKIDAVCSYSLKSQEKRKEYYAIIKGDAWDEDILFAHAHSRGYREYKGLGWILQVRYNAGEVFAPIIKLRNFMLVVLDFGVIAAIVMGLFLSHHISRPIIRLVKALQEIGREKLDVNIDVTSKDEIGDLERSFNQMSVSLKRSRDARKMAIESERAKARELRVLKETLEIKVEERTKELEGKVRELDKNRKAMLYMVEDLNAQTKELKAAQDHIVNSEKLATIGKLAGIVSHEMRNPLAVIRNTVYFLKLKLKESKDDKIRKHLNILEKETKKASSIINDILDFASIKPPSLSKENINSIILKSIDEAQIPAEIKVKTDLKEDLPEIPVDISQISRVFPNLISNAVQAMPDGGELQVITSRADDFIKIVFKDSGYGIAREQMSKIFQPLFTTKPNGIGLGTTVCQAIIENHRGTIEVEGEQGKGTTFVIKLPVS